MLRCGHPLCCRSSRIGRFPTGCSFGKVLSRSASCPERRRHVAEPDQTGPDGQHCEEKRRFCWSHVQRQKDEDKPDPTYAFCRTTVCRKNVIQSLWLEYAADKNRKRRRIWFGDEMARGLESRIKQHGRNRSEAKKRKRQNETPDEYEARLLAARKYKQKRVVPTTLEDVERIDVIFSTSDRRFDVLRVRTGNGYERGLIDAGISKRDGQEHVTFCARCDRSLSRRRIPKFSIASGFRITEVPECLSVLNPMEARMIGLGVCFTTCFCLGYLGQAATRGNSINFWNDTYDIITKLPRPATRCGVIRLKRADSRSGDTYYHVRPWLLRAALTWLIANNPVYHEVLIDEDLLSSMPAAADVPTVEIAPDDSVDEELDATAEEVDQSHGVFDESFVLEHATESSREEDAILDALKGQHCDEAYLHTRHDKPMNEYITKLLMQCCFPTLFPHGRGGFHPIEDVEEREHEFKLAEYCCHLMSWHDRRFITHPTFKFFCLNLLQRRQIDGLLLRVRHRGSESEGTATPGDREGKDSGENTASRSSTKVNVSQYLKDLRPFFRSVRGTGLYWANVRDDLMTIIGNPAMENRWPTFFVTLSAADTVWPDFFRVCDPRLSFSEAAELSPAQKRKLLNQNPDLAARHFHRRFQAFFKHILCGKTKPLGEIVDFFWRIEFQRRGSPHVHALLWIKDTPDILELSKTPEGVAQLREFADKFVSCMRFGQHHDSVELSGDPICRRPPSIRSFQEREIDVHAMVDRVQLHVCTSRSSCQRQGACRFGFPKSLRHETDVVRVDKNGATRISFEHKRDDVSTNNYNPTMLALWRANMDVKIIGNAYGAAEYTAAYVSKAEPDTVRFRKTIEGALRKLPNGVPYERLLKRTASAVLAIREVSAQETVYILSNALCLYGKSRTVLKVKVSRHDRRFYRVDSRSVAIEVAARETAMIEPIEHAYMHRPNTEQFENMPYREFCESYEVSPCDKAAGQHLERWQLVDGGGYIKARQRKQLVRPSPRYRTNEQDPDYCYSQLFLHTPWRRLCDLPSEDDDITITYGRWKMDQTSRWTAHIDEGIARAQIIEASKTADITLPSPCWALSLDDSNPVISMTTPPNHQPESPFGYRPRFEYSSDDIARARRFVHDVVRPACHSEQRATDQREPLPLLYPTHDQTPSMTSDQWKPFAIWMRQSRLRYYASLHGGESCEPVQMVVSGEGGTGKSWLIQQVIQDIGIVFGRSEVNKRVLLSAHQGSAAFLIGGRTLTSALGLPSRESFRGDYIPLTQKRGGDSTLRRLQSELEFVHLIVIDEFGVISCGMLNWIDQRLREIYPRYCDCPFGGRDILFTGDPSQLGPVKPSPLSTPTSMLTSQSEKDGRVRWEEIPLYYILRQQNRGVADPEWYEMLRRVRAGDTTRKDVELINSRVCVPPANRPLDLVCLAYRNVDVEAMNESALRRLAKPVYSINAHHDVQFWDTSKTQSVPDETTQEQLLREAHGITTSGSNYLPLQLNLVDGAPVVLTYNVEQRAGLCNGSRGTVFDIIPDDETPKHHPIVLMQLKDYHGPSFVAGVPGIVPITSRSALLTSKKDGPYRLTRTALPLRLGFATTIHKIQGRTCDIVAFNPERLKDAALAYVALSRVRQRSHIFVTKALTMDQLEKKESSRKAEDAEDVRVAVIEQKSIELANQRIPAMKSLAYAHNLQFTTAQ